MTTGKFDLVIIVAGIIACIYVVIEIAKHLK